MNDSLEMNEQCFDMHKFETTKYYIAMDLMELVIDYFMYHEVIDWWLWLIDYDNVEELNL